MRTTLVMVTALFALACLSIARQVPAPKEKSVAKAKPLGEGKSADRPEDTKAIQALAESFARAYDQGDAKAIARLFTENATLTDESETTVEGREAIEAHFAGAFKEQPGSKIKSEVASLRFLGTDAAKETGHTRILPDRGGTPESSRYTVIYVKRDGRWLHDSIEESAETMLNPHERLMDLAWLVGEWVDEGDDGVVHTSCRWSENKNFLIREFTMRFAGEPVMRGTQRIGWDPVARQFKSWVFDDDGSSAEGYWERDGENCWVIKASGVVADGRSARATQVLTFVNKDILRWRSVDRAIGGRLIPDLREVVLVRTPPKPISTVPAPTNPTKPARTP